MTLPRFLSEEWFWAMMQFIGVTASLVYLSRQVHAQRMSTMLTTMETLTAKLNCDRMQDARRELCNAFLENRNTKPSTMSDGAHVVASWLNDVGVLVEHGVLDADLVWSRYSNYVENYWILLKAGIIKYRDTTKDQSWFKSFENLHPRMLKITWCLSKEARWRQRLARYQPMPAPNPTLADENLLAFVRDEISRLPRRPLETAPPASAAVPAPQPISGILRQVAVWLDGTGTR